MTGRSARPAGVASGTGGALHLTGDGGVLKGLLRLQGGGGRFQSALQSVDACVIAGGGGPGCHDGQASFKSAPLSLSVHRGRLPRRLPSGRQSVDQAGCCFYATWLRPFETKQLHRITRGFQLSDRVFGGALQLHGGNSFRFLIQSATKFNRINNGMLTTGRFF